MIAGSDRGGVTITMCAMVALGALVSTHVASFGRSVIAQTEAQFVADAVALAGVVGLRPAAQRIARANGAILVEYAQEREAGGLGVTVRVGVEFADHTARSSATDRG